MLNSPSKLALMRVKGVTVHIFKQSTFRFSATLIASIILLFVTICSAHSETLTKVKLELIWKHQFQFAGFYAAVEQGYFRQAGIEVEISELDPNKIPINQVLNGKDSLLRLQGLLVCL